MKRIGIAGIGGIGSNVARHLAQASVPSITIVDFDLVEAANLNRQFYQISQQGARKTDSLAANLKEIFPAMTIQKINQQIRPGDARSLFADYDIVVEGLDDKRLKQMLIEELAESETTVVSASGIAGPEMDSVRIKKLGSCYIVGDFVSDEQHFSLFPPKVALVASIMAGIVLKETSYAEYITK